MSEGSVTGVDQGFLAAVRELAGDTQGDVRSSRRRPLAPDAPVREASGLVAERAIEVFEAQMTSRHLDFAARLLRGRGQGYYTIGSSGHEGNAAVAEALDVSDPALLHYRSGAFFVQRAHKARALGLGSGSAAHSAVDPVRDVLLGLVASREEPIAGGRHKVLGSAPLNIWPQTSTIASHLPKSVGMAFALERKKRMNLGSGPGRSPGHDPASRHSAIPADAIVVCSLGDASINHSTAVGAINTACLCAHQSLPVPILFVCEDNGLGISVRTPPGWIAETYRDRLEMRYFSADGCDLVATHDAARAAAEYVRDARAPAFLHLSVVRLMGHAGSDVEMAYRNASEIRSELVRDPLRRSAEILVRAGALTADQVIARYERIRDRVADEVASVTRTSNLRDADDVMAVIAPRRPDAVATRAAARVDPVQRSSFWRNRLPEDEGAMPLAGHIRHALGDLLVEYPELILFGEDVGRKGGVYGLTRGLQERASMARVFDTPLDEQAILGMAIGAGQAGLLPIAEVQYLAYLHNAIDQLRGEAATLSFFSRAQLKNPMVVRIASYAYQKGFGGHFHNDNSIAALGDIPGLVIASPSRGDDAAAMLRTCVAAARLDGTVSVFLEPIALYNTRDLHDEGDGLLAPPYRLDRSHVAIGSARVWNVGKVGEEGDEANDRDRGGPTDVLVVSFANGVVMSRRAARRVMASHGIRCQVLDLRWLAPLPVDDLMEAAGRTRNILVVDETRQTGGVSERIITALVDRGYSGRVRRVASLDSFVPLGPAAGHILLSESDISAAIVTMAGER